MSEDWTVRTTGEVDPDALLRILAEVVTGPSNPATLNAMAAGLTVREERSGGWLVLADQDQRPQVWVAAGAQRVADGVLAVEVCAPGQHALAPYPSHFALVRDIAEALAARLDGHAERLSSARVTPATSTAPPPLTADCPADLLSEQTSVVIQTRPVVSWSPWLLHQLQWAAEHDRVLTLVTSPTCSLTPVASAMLTGIGGQWLIDTGAGLYDGHLGYETRWDGTTFETGEEIHPGFESAGPDQWTLVVNAETILPYDRSARVGAFTQALYAAAGLRRPTGAGMLEPPEAPFDPGLLTEVAQQVSPSSCRFAVSSTGADGVVDVLPQELGIVEQVEITADAPAQLLPPAAVEEFAVRALNAGAHVAVLGYRKATGPRLVPGRRTGPTEPVVAVFARDRFPTLGDAGALRLAGRGAQLVQEPAEALVVRYDQEVTSGIPGTQDEAPSARLSRLIDGLLLHDTFAPKE